MTGKEKVLFICTHNAARSQMAEGYLRARYGDRFEAFSAGTEISLVHPMAVEVMKEIGIDISGQRPKLVTEFYGKGIGIAVTVCDAGKKVCPFFPAKTVLQESFPDPSGFTGSDEEIRDGFRRVRDAIIRWIDATFGEVRNKGPGAVSPGPRSKAPDAPEGAVEPPEPSLDPPPKTG